MCRIEHAAPRIISIFSALLKEGCNNFQDIRTSALMSYPFCLVLKLDVLLGSKPLPPIFNCSPASSFWYMFRPTTCLNICLALLIAKAVGFCFISITSVFFLHKWMCLQHLLVYQEQIFFSFSITSIWLNLIERRDSLILIAKGLLTKNFCYILYNLHLKLLDLISFLRSKFKVSILIRNSK